MPIEFGIIDTIIIVAYLLIILLWTFYYSSDKEENSSNYFFAGKNLGWFAIGISLFATNISSEHFIGLAGSGAAKGLAVGQFELIAIFFLILLGWIIAPIYKNVGIVTTPEFLEKRFNRSSRKLFSAISIFTYIITKILVTLFAGGFLFHKILGWNIFTTSVIIVLLTGLYTLVGGFRAVIKTQIFQGVLLLAAAVLVTGFGLAEVGGFSGLRQNLPPEYFNMFKSINDPDFPWTGIIFGAPIIAFWYWCADQYIVQRVIASKSIQDARTGALFSSVLKIFPIFILVLPGLVAVSLFPEIKGDEAFPALVSSGILPVGVKGIVIVGLLAAMMSSLSAAFNSIATLFTLDFYKTSYPNASERTLVLVGRLATIIVVVLVLILIPFVKIVNSHIYIFLQSTQAYISAPVTAIFLLGIFIKGIKARSVFISLLIGEFIGISRFIIELMVNNGLINNPILLEFAGINYLHFTIYLFLATASLLLILSFAVFNKEEINSFNLKTYLGDGIKLKKIGAGTISLANTKVNILFSTILVILVLSLWSVFN